MKHPLNGRRASEWDKKHSLCVIAQIPFNPPYPPLTPQEPPARAMVQVVLRPDKMTEMGLIRLGETLGDEANCWIHPHDILIVEVLGRAVEGADGKWQSLEEPERTDLRAVA